MAGNSYTAPSDPLVGFKGSVKYSIALLMQNVRQANFRRKLTEPLDRPLEAIMGTEGRSQTSFTYPFIQITDLAQSKTGDRVTCDLMNRIQAAPVMGDVEMKPFAVPLSYVRDQVSIDLYNLAINAGGLMSQQRNPHDMQKGAIQQAAMWSSDLEDNLCTVQICGARGYDTSSGWQIPVDGSPTLLPMMAGNPINPPTLNRYYQPGGGKSVSTIGTSAVITLEFFDYLRTCAMNSPVPLQGIVMSGGKKESGNDYNVGNDSTPLYIAGVTMEQYNTLRTQASPGDWNTFITNANTRLDFRRHPLFADGECGLWRNIFFFVYGRPVIFPAGSNVTEYTDATSSATRVVAANNRVHRGFMLGAQAMGMAFGDCTPRKSGKIAASGMNKSMQSCPYNWSEEIVEGNLRFFYIRAMQGMKKLQYNFTGAGSGNTNPVLYDNGVVIFDTYQVFNADFGPV